MEILSILPLIIIGIAVLALVLWPSVLILRKTGYTGWWVLLMIVPLVNLISIWMFAFARWPAVDDAPRQAGPFAGTDAPPPSHEDYRDDAPAHATPAERLAHLDSLLDRGLISADEHARKRKDILDSI